jgi:hypothetical protein
MMGGAGHVSTDMLPPILKVETACLSEASVSIYRARRCNNTEDSLNGLRKFLDELSEHKLLNEFSASWLKLLCPFILKLI